MSGAIGADNKDIKNDRLKVIRDRYNLAMNFLKSPDDAPGSNNRTKVDTYVMKQSAWAAEVSRYSEAQGQALRDSQAGMSSSGASTSQIKEAREKYMQWLQEHARDVSVKFCRDALPTDREC